jgi:hypothetical protein
MSKKTLQTCTPLNNINSSMDRSKITDAATTVMEERQSPSSRDGLIAVSASWAKI